jgi:hypothetical protein
VDWDGVGTFALFLSSGAVGLGVIALRAYKARLANRLEVARIEAAGNGPDLDLEQISDLEMKVARLSERLEFNEKLLEEGRPGVPRDGT